MAFGSSRPWGLRRGGASSVAILLLSVVLGGVGCAPAPAAGSGGSGALRVVAAENFWGSIAAQLGGTKVSVTNIINNPNTDPHDYEATSVDARSIAGAQYVLVNGAGYDTWASKLLAANPIDGRKDLNIATLLGKTEGDNEHLWYGPSYVLRVADQITADYKSLDRADATYFDQQNTAFKIVALKEYTSLIATIKAKYAGTPIGITEPVFGYMAAALGLPILTPPGFVKAIDEGEAPSAEDKATYDQQIKQKAIKVFVYNSQNDSPDVRALRDEAQQAGIPVVTVTETLSPAGASFQQWQVAQLQSLQHALATATGK